MAKYIYTNGSLVNVDELTHYGIVGMKWGVRNDHDDSVASRSRSYKKVYKSYYDYDPSERVRVNFGGRTQTRSLGSLKLVAKNFDEILERTGHKRISEITYDHDPSMFSSFAQTSIGAIMDAYQEYRDSEDWD